MYVKNPKSPKNPHIFFLLNIALGQSIAKDTEKPPKLAPVTIFKNVYYAQILDRRETLLDKNNHSSLAKIRQ